MAEDEIVVYYGETTKVIGKFEAGSRGLDVLEVVETMTTEKGSVVFCANGRAVTKGSRNLVAGSYRFDPAPAPTPAPTPENSGGDEFWEALKVILLGPAWPTTTEVWTGIKRFNSMMSGGFKGTSRTCNDDTSRPLLKDQELDQHSHVEYGKPL